MARIKLGPLVTDISGSIGMATIQRNRFGHTLRLKPLPKKSETSAQYIVRQHMITIQNAWQALTDAERLQWDRFINFSGQTIRKDKSVLLSGHKLYIKYQLFRLLTGEALLTTIVYSPMPDFKQFDAWAIIGGPALEIQFEAEVNHNNYFFLLKISSPRREGTAFNPRGLRFMLVPLSSATGYDITAQYIAAFGALPIAENYLHYSIQYFSVVAPVYSGIFTGTL